MQRKTVIECTRFYIKDVGKLCWPCEKFHFYVHIDNFYKNTANVNKMMPIENTLKRSKGT